MHARIFATSDYRLMAAGGFEETRFFLLIFLPNDYRLMAVSFS
jgi:hypothetical protein